MDFINDQDTTPLPTPEELLERYGDPLKLAEGKIEADKTIKQRERENEELRKVVDQLKSKEEVFEEILARIDQNNEPPTPRTNQGTQPDPVPANQTLSNEDLAERIRAELERADRKRTIETNTEQVTKRMLAEFGHADKANEFVKTKAAELGVGIDFLQSVASQNPKAFYSMLGLNVETSSPPRATQSSVNPEGLRSDKPKAERPYSYYREMRRKDPGRYNSREVQNQLVKDAAAYPDGVAAFYKT